MNENLETKLTRLYEQPGMRNGVLAVMMVVTMIGGAVMAAGYLLQWKVYWWSYVVALISGLNSALLFAILTWRHKKVEPQKTVPVIPSTSKPAILSFESQRREDAMVSWKAARDSRKTVVSRL